MMNEVIPGLWIGDLPSALNVDKLKANKIYSILSAMRGRITVNETFIRHQILIDDTQDADILVHFLPSIHFIQAELDKGRGVLVHCQAGVSRSATIIAAYLMYHKNIDPEKALELVREARPYIDPNPNFLQQLELFHKAQYRISKKSKDIRRYYLDRTVEEVMNGDGTISGLNMFASYPRTPASDSTPPTPSPVPRRRIRCKMCRQELATREHMLDHGQLGPATPASVTPVTSRRSSEVQRKESFGQAITGSSVASAGQRRPSRSRPSFGSIVLGDSLTMSTIDSGIGEKRIVEEPGIGFEAKNPSLSRTISGAERLKNFRSLSRSLMDSSLTMSSAVEDDDDDDEGEIENTPEHIQVEAAKLLGRRLSDALITPAPESNRDTPVTPDSIPSAGAQEALPATNELSAENREPMTTHLMSPTDLAQFYAHPKIASLRSPSLSSPNPPLPMSPATSPSLPKPPIISAPIIMNSKCSGYFVEPMKWMEPFLQDGRLSGKIACPNKRCGAKLGNYDWAGVCCGCKEWVVPGFCINRSKVDEVTI